MKIKFFTLDELDKNLKATIHKTGKMGFTSDAAKKLDLVNMKSANIGVNEDDPSDQNLYLAVYPGVMSGAFRVVKSGAYYYINTKVLFDNLKIDYLSENVTYDMSTTNLEGQTIYLLKRRKKDKKEKDDDFGS